MGYEINVTLNGKHFFATHERSAMMEHELKRILTVFMKKFPKEEGYEISVTRWEKIGKRIDIERAMK